GSSRIAGAQPPQVVRVSVMAGLGPVARAEQVEPGEAAILAGVGVGLLLDDEPAGAEPLRPQPELPVQMQAIADRAGGGLDELKVLGAAEPAGEPFRDRLGTCPLPCARGEQGAHPGIGGERAAKLGEVLSGEAVKERAGALRSRHCAGHPVAAGCRHGPVVRVRAVIAVSGNPPTWAIPNGHPSSFPPAMAPARWPSVCSGMACLLREYGDRAGADARHGACTAQWLASAR